MKFFFKCFLLYFFSLALLPCAEAAVHLTENKTATVQSKNDNDRECNHDDDCSPLCSCTCCAHLLVKQQEFVITNSHRSIHFISPRYASPLADMHYPVWQPPRLK